MNNRAPASTSPLLLRRYEPGDEAAVCALHERALRQVEAFLLGPWNDDLHDIPAVYLNHGGEFLVGVIDGRIVAMGALRRTDAERAELKRMRVDPACQRRGYGRAMLLALEERAREIGYQLLHLNTTARQTAAIHLYRTHGYHQTGRKTFKGLEVLFFEKRLCPDVIDDTCWAPLAVNAVARLFSEIRIPWWIGGGQALDLYLGRQTRPHVETDILILRRDQLIVQEYLQNWQLFKTQQPGLAPWPAGEVLHPPVNSIWARRGEGAPWAFEIMLMETEGDEWVYRRLPAIRGPIAGLGLRTAEGIPYLRPEIQLLYKGRQEYRSKDLQDLQEVLPYLPIEKREWLLDCLRRQFPQGHDWIDYLNDPGIAGVPRLPWDEG